MEVHRQLGCGFVEPVYQEALAIEFTNLHSKYCADFICFNSIVVELKALARTSGTEEAQVINYLKATGNEVGLLINFGARSLEHRRFVLSKSV
jgi:hypothetical protein